MATVTDFRAASGLISCTSSSVGSAGDAWGRTWIGSRTCSSSSKCSSRPSNHLYDDGSRLSLSFVCSNDRSSPLLTLVWTKRFETFEMFNLFSSQYNTVVHQQKESVRRVLLWAHCPDRDSSKPKWAKNEFLTDGVHHSKPVECFQVFQWEVATVRRLSSTLCPSPSCGVWSFPVWEWAWHSCRCHAGTWHTRAATFGPCTPRTAPRSAWHPWWCKLASPLGPGERCNPRTGNRRLKWTNHSVKQSWQYCQTKLPASFANFGFERCILDGHHVSDQIVHARGPLCLDCVQTVGELKVIVAPFAVGTIVAILFGNAEHEQAGYLLGEFGQARCGVIFDKQFFARFFTVKWRYEFSGRKNQR